MEYRKKKDNGEMLTLGDLIETDLNSRTRMALSPIPTGKYSGELGNILDDDIEGSLNPTALFT